MSTIDLLDPMTGAAGANGVYGYPHATNGGSGGAAYTGILGNTVTITEGATTISLQFNSAFSAGSILRSAPMAMAAQWSN